MMKRVLAAATIVLFAACGCALAQVGMTLPGSGAGTTSPLGMTPGSSSVGMTGIPLGATELATPGLSPGPVSGACSATGSPSTSAQFDSGGVGMGVMDPGGASLGTGGTTPCTQTTTATTSLGATSSGVSGTLGIPTIPMGSTGLGNAGLSPAPCPSTGYSPSATNGAYSGTC
jgi:hypothetical protein